MTTEAHVQPFFHESTGTWTYVVHAGRDAVVIDPVLDYDHRSGRIHTGSAREVLDYLDASELQVHQILETHAHADHLSAAAFLRARIDAPIAIGNGIRSVQEHFSKVFGMEADDPLLSSAFDRLLTDGETFTAGGLSIEVMATPGHTADSLSYRIGNNVFVGDTVFAPDLGTARCDFPGGSIDQLYASITRLHGLPDQTVLWLCHDYPPEGRERRSSVPVEESRHNNRMLSADTTLEAFRAARSERDAGLAAPNLLYPSLQVNIRGGRLPAPQTNDRRYLCTPLQVEPPAEGL